MPFCPTNAFDLFEIVTDLGPKLHEIRILRGVEIRVTFFQRLYEKVNLVPRVTRVETEGAMLLRVLCVEFHGHLLLRIVGGSSGATEVLIVVVTMPSPYFPASSMNSGTDNRIVAHYGTRKALVPRILDHHDRVCELPGDQGARPHLQPSSG